MTKSERLVFDTMTQAEQRAWLDGARWGVLRAYAASCMACEEPSWKPADALAKLPAAVVEEADGE